MMTCDWCQSPMTDIGPETTGMEASAGWPVWLCNKPACGHERSGKRCAIQPAPTLVVDEGHSVTVESAKWRKHPIRSYDMHFRTPASYFVHPRGVSQEWVLYMRKCWD